MPKTNAIQKAREIAESRDDARAAHFRALGPFTDQVLHSQVLCLTYVQPSVTEGGIHIPDRGIEEDRFQGKIFLVVAMGAGAFKDDKIAQFHGASIQPGDWVLARPSDGMELFINGNSVRLFEDVDIRMKIEQPKRYW
jgi:co-chaperonin GroES (HSP10)